MILLPAVEPFPVDVRPDLLDWLTAIGTVGAVLVAVGIAITEARRAHKANKERDAVIEKQRLTERRATAKLVSAWIERRFIPHADGTNYVQSVTAHIANVSESPVFEVIASVSLIPPFPDGSRPVSLGPLSIPSPIRVLPPNRELEFDLSRPLRAHRDEGESGATPEVPGIEISFTDQNDIRWVRELDGALVESARTIGEVIEAPDDSAGQRQLGTMDENNPMAVVLGFLSLLSNEDLDDGQVLDQIRITLSPDAGGWSDLNLERIASLRVELSDYNIGTFVQYPASNVAYVKIINETEKAGYVVGEGVLVRAKIVTLVYSEDLGWRIFTYGGGGTDPDRIYFPSGMPT